MLVSNQKSTILKRLPPVTLSHSNFAALATCFWLALQVITFGVHMAEHLPGLQLCPWACTDVPRGDLFTSTPGSISTNPIF